MSLNPSILHLFKIITFLLSPEGTIPLVTHCVKVIPGFQIPEATMGSDLRATSCTFGEARQHCWACGARNHRDLKDGGRGGNERERRREDAEKTQRVAFPLILGKNPDLAWGLGVPGMPADLGWERTYGARESLRSAGCCALKEQTVLWEKVFSGKESLNKVTSALNKFLLTCCDVPGTMLRRVLKMMVKVLTQMELTL